MITVWNVAVPASPLHKQLFPGSTKLSRQVFGNTETEAWESFIREYPYNVKPLRDTATFERVTSIELQDDEDGTVPLCGDDPQTGEHWSWFGNHEPGCPHAE